MATKKVVHPVAKKAVPAKPVVQTPVVKLKPKAFKRGADVNVKRRDGTTVKGTFVSSEDKVNGRWMTVNLSAVKGKPEHLVARASMVTAAG